MEQRTHQGANHLATRVEGAPTPLGRAPCLVGTRWPSSTYSCTHPLLLPPTNTKNQLKHEFQLLMAMGTRYPLTRRVKTPIRVRVWENKIPMGI